LALVVELLGVMLQQLWYFLLLLIFVLAVVYFLLPTSLFWLSVYNLGKLLL